MKQPNSNRKIYEFEKLSEKFYIHIVRDGACQVFFRWISGSEKELCVFRLFHHQQRSYYQVLQIDIQRASLSVALSGEKLQSKKNFRIYMHSHTN